MQPGEYNPTLLDGKHTWARLRVFDDGTADAWKSAKLCGFCEEQWARIYIGESHFADLATLKAIPEFASLVPQSPPQDANSGIALTTGGSTRFMKLHGLSTTF